MGNEYVELRGGLYYITGTRISLDSVVYAFNRGESPEEILNAFPSLENVARISGAIAVYLDRKQEIDQYLEDRKRWIEANSIPLEIWNPTLYAKYQHYLAERRVVTDS